MARKVCGNLEFFSLFTKQSVRPAVHVFGHVHEGYGVTTDGATVFINAATLRDSNPVRLNAPVVFDLLPAPPLVLSLAQAGQAEESLVGGKALQLGVLTRLAAQTTPPPFDVPQGYVLTCAAYDAWVADAKDMAAAIGAKSWPLAAAATDMPESVRAVLARMNWGGQDARWAARSSGVGEDSATQSHAGEYATELNVPGQLDALCTAVVAVWRSAAPSATRMAVVLQQMVLPAAAGVLFTADPLDACSGTMVAEAVWGLGEGLVSGEVTPTRARLPWFGGGAQLVETPVQERKMAPCPDGGVAWAPTTAAEAGASPLADPCVMEQLRSAGMAIAQEYGRPMDIEFGVLHGVLYALQARPITLLSFQAREHDRAEGSWICPLGSLVCLLGQSLIVEGFARAAHRVLHAHRRHDPAAPPPQRLYFNQMYVPEWTTAVWRPSQVDEAVADAIDQFARHHDAWLAPPPPDHDLAAMPTAELHSRTAALLDVYADAAALSWQVGSACELCTTKVEKLLAAVNDQLVDTPAFDLGLLMTGVTPKTQVLQLAALAAHAVTELPPPLLAMALDDAVPTAAWLEAWQQAAASDADVAGWAAVQAYIATYYYISDNDEDLAAESWGEAPLAAFQVLRQHVQSHAAAPQQPAAPIRSVSAEFASEAQRLEAMQAQLPDLAHLLHWLECQRRLLRAKERIHLTYVKIGRNLKALALQVAARAGLQAPTDVLYMPASQLRDHLTGVAGAAQFCEAATQQAASFRMWRKFDNPFRVGSQSLQTAHALRQHQNLAGDRDPAARASVLFGHPVSVGHGEATGPVRIVQRVQDMHLVSR